MATTLAKYEVPLPSKPPIVEDLSVVSTTYNTITLSWQFMENVYFEIQISEDIKIVVDGKQYLIVSSLL